VLPFCLLQVCSVTLSAPALQKFCQLVFFAKLLCHRAFRRQNDKCIPVNNCSTFVDGEDISPNYIMEGVEGGGGVGTLPVLAGGGGEVKNRLFAKQAALHSTPPCL
jgi:hypothetical protein